MDIGDPYYMGMGAMYVGNDRVLRMRIVGPEERREARFYDPKTGKLVWQCNIEAELKVEQKRKMNRIWKAFCEADMDAHDARECVRLVNLARQYICDKPPLCLTKRPRKSK